VNKEGPHREHASALHDANLLCLTVDQFTYLPIRQHAGEVRSFDYPQRAILVRRGIKMDS
jgi:hypothetical protein